MASTPLKFYFADLTLDTATHQLLRDGKAINLAPQTYDLLLYLLENNDRVVSKDELQNKVWGTIVSDAAITRGIMKLRRALSDSDESIISTVPKVGYRLVAAVSETKEETPTRNDYRRVLIAGAGILLAVTAILVVSFDRDEPTAVDQSIAVLPFKNLSDNGENRYFSDGFMEAILNELASIRELRVISRTSVEAYRDSTKSIPEIGKELDVTHILEGSVQKAGDQVRVAAQLIAVEDDRHIWSRSYDGDLSDIFVIQSEIADGIASNLKLILTSERKAILANGPTSELRAYDAYLRGRYGGALFGRYFGERPVAEIREARAHCERAIQLDLEFYLAYVCTAQAWFELGLAEYLSRDEWYPESSRHLDHAIEIDPSAWEAYGVYAQIHFAMGDPKTALEYARNVLSRNPNEADFLALAGDQLTMNGRVEEGVDLVLRSLESIPPGGWSREAAVVGFRLATVAPEMATALVKQQYDAGNVNDDEAFYILSLGSLINRDYESVAEYFSLLTEARDTPNNRINLGAALGFLGKYEEQRAIYESIIAMQGDEEESFMKHPFLARYAISLWRSGETERGLEILHANRVRLENSISDGTPLHANNGAPYELAVTYAFLGEKGKAVEMLRFAREHINEGAFINYGWVIGDTELDPLRDHPAYIEFEQEYRHDYQHLERVFREQVAERHKQGKLLWIDLDIL